MLTIRIIPCLDIDEGGVVKGVKFKELVRTGDPVERALTYYEQGADEITLLDVGATYKSRRTMLDIISSVANQIFVPLTAGGGVRTIEDIRLMLNAGTDKVALCTAALEKPVLIAQAAEKFGSQCIVLSIDARRHNDTWFAYTCGGRYNSGREVVVWAKQGEELGAGEILLNSIDQDGTRKGYDLELLQKVCTAVNVPVIASGGAGSLGQVYAAINIGQADAVLLASLLHYNEYSIQDIKKYLVTKGVAIRW